ncbi:uncharacterized protein LOC111253942 [Varroa destructor]|uniref:Uncharacterized protein n=1 Tax=Varroa destructor TaxID=109461 RepID=A0A7M7KPF5_VARDE|nr:uncharacterized protein LOC111253942 [Varroa destructor]
MSVYMQIVLLATAWLGQMEDMGNAGGPSRLFKPPFPATTVEVTPKFKVVSERGPFSISTGISFPIELELDSEPEAIRELDEPRSKKQLDQSTFGRVRLADDVSFAPTQNDIMHKKTKFKRNPLKTDTSVSREMKKIKREMKELVKTTGFGSRENRAVLPPDRTLRALQERLQLFRSITLSLNQVGLVGEQCLLRAICEAAKFPQADEEGLVGQIVTLLLTIPENSVPEMASYNEATERGKAGKNCTGYSDCPISVFNVRDL